MNTEKIERISGGMYEFGKNKNEVSRIYIPNEGNKAHDPDPDKKISDPVWTPYSIEGIRG
jgi:hypothetical protein